MMLRLLLLLTLLWATPSWAAITFDASSDSPDNETSASTSWSHTVGAGSDRFLVVNTQARGPSSEIANLPVSTLTYGGVALTRLKFHEYNDGSTVFRVEQWGLVAPTVGTATVAVTFTGVPSEYGVGSSQSFFGVNQSITADADASASSTGTTLSTTITTVAANAWIVDTAVGRDDGGLTVGAGQTMRTDRVVGVSEATNDGVGVSTVNGKATPGAEVMDWTQPSAVNWAQSAIALAPSGGAEPPPSSPSTATLSWTNGIDNTGVTSAILRRCLGTSCTPSTTLTTLSASNASAGVYVDNTLAMNTTYGYSVGNADAAGNQSAFTAPVYITTGTSYRTNLAFDTFDRANNADLGASWDAGYTGKNALAITENHLKVTAIGTDSIESYNAISTPNDQWARDTIAAIAGGGTRQSGVFVRLANAPTVTGYECHVTFPSTSKIREWTAGTPADLTSVATWTWAIGDRRRCEVQGTSIRFYAIRNGATTLISSTTDASIASGKAGLFTTIGTGVVTDLYSDDFAVGGFDTVPLVAPSITGLTVDATGATVTFGATTPTWIRVAQGSNVFGPLSSIEYPIASFPAGRFTETWLAGRDYVGFHPIDSVRDENPNPDDNKYASLVGVGPGLDTTPPVLSNCQPSGSLPFGTTSFNLQCDVDKVATARYDTTDAAYDTLANTMTTAALRVSVTLTGLTNGMNQNYYIRAQSTDALGGLHPMTTSQTVNVSVLAGAGADTTAPSTVAGLSATLENATSAILSWTAATDNVAVSGYQVYQSTWACSTYTVAGAPVTATQTLVALAPSTVHCWKVRAIDSSNNLSAADSNVVTITTVAVPDLTPPSDMTNLQISAAFQQSILLTWNAGTDDRGPALTSMEQCTVIAPATTCSNFQQIRSIIAIQQLAVTLTAGTTYCFRGRHSDVAGNTSAYSNTVCGTTTSSGLLQPRAVVPFGVTRLPRN